MLIARFVPIVRTFAPFVAGMGHMVYSRFLFYAFAGAILWIGSLTYAGYFFGNLPIVKDNLEKVIWALILVPGLIAIFGAWRARRASAASPSSWRASCPSSAPSRPSSPAWPR